MGPIGRLLCSCACCDWCQARTWKSKLWSSHNRDDWSPLACKNSHTMYQRLVHILSEIKRLRPAAAQIDPLKAPYWSFKGFIGDIHPPRIWPIFVIFRHPRGHSSAAKRATGLIFGVEVLPTSHFPPRKLSKKVGSCVFFKKCTCFFHQFFQQSMDAIRYDTTRYDTIRIYHWLYHGIYHWK